MGIADGTSLAERVHYVGCIVVYLGQTNNDVLLGKTTSSGLDTEVDCLWSVFVRFLHHHAHHSLSKHVTDCIFCV